MSEFGVPKIRQEFLDALRVHDLSLKGCRTCWCGPECWHVCQSCDGHPAPTNPELNDCIVCRGRGPIIMETGEPCSGFLPGPCEAYGFRSATGVARETLYVHAYGGPQVTVTEGGTVEIDEIPAGMFENFLRRGRR